jgi:hypothetical protein
LRASYSRLYVMFASLQSATLVYTSYTTKNKRLAQQ